MTTLSPDELKHEAALNDMPNMVGTPDTNAYHRSNEQLQKWYYTYYSAIRSALTAQQANGCAETSGYMHVEGLPDGVITKGSGCVFHDLECSPPDGKCIHATQNPRSRV